MFLFENNALVIQTSQEVVNKLRAEAVVEQMTKKEGEPTLLHLMDVELMNGKHQGVAFQCQGHVTVLYAMAAPVSTDNKGENDQQEA